MSLDPAQVTASPLTTAAVVGASAVALAASSRLLWSLALAPLAAGLAYLWARPSADERTTRPSAMKVRPWGIEIEGPVPWHEIECISHERTVRSDGHNREEVVYSVVRVEVSGKRFGGRCLHESILDALDAVLPLYTAETRRPIALTLRATGPEVASTSTDAFRRLLSATHEFLHTDEGRELSSAESTGYREAKRHVRPETGLTLTRFLLEAPQGADRAPMAAVLAAELGVRGVTDELLELTLSPNPFVAAICRAAAQRLGVHPSRSFPVNEVAPFIDTAVIQAMESWAAGGSPE